MTMIKECMLLLLCVALTSSAPAKRYVYGHGHHRRHNIRDLDDGSKVEFIEELEDDDLMDRDFDQQVNQPCVPAIPGLRCTPDICGDPAGIVRNCCQEFCGVNGPFRTFARTYERRGLIGKLTVQINDGQMSYTKTEAEQKQ